MPSAFIDFTDFTDFRLYGLSIIFALQEAGKDHRTNEHHA